MAGQAAAINFGFMYGVEGADLDRGRSSEESAAPRDFGAGLRKYLLNEFCKGRMTSEQVCTLGWHCTAAGAQGVADLALNPKYQRQAEHLRRAMDVRARETFYVARIPMWDHTEERRTFIEFPLDLPHEAFSRLHAQDPERFVLQPRHRPDLPPSFFAHDVYIANGDKTCPIGYFSDAVPHTKRDSFFAFYWNNMLEGVSKRHLICALRKADLCQCGCNGFCTIWECAAHTRIVICMPGRRKASGAEPRLPAI